MKFAYKKVNIREVNACIVNVKIIDRAKTVRQ